LLLSEPLAFGGGYVRFGFVSRASVRTATINDVQRERS
jgi:hypothetical protein